MIRDLTYGIRTLWRTPAFTLIAVLTIALGIAGNTAIFSAIDEQVLRSLPVPHPEQLVELQPTGAHDSFPIPTFEYLRDHTKSLDGMFASDDGRSSILINGQSDFVWNMCVSGNYEAVMGVRPILGRGLTSDDDKLGSSPVAVLGYGYWKRKFGGSPSVIGSSIFAKEMALKIVGVFPDMDHWRADVWLPMALHPALALKDHTTVAIFARLRPGLNPSAIGAELSVAYQQALTDIEGQALTPAKQREIAESKLRLVPIGRGGSRSFSTELQILAAAVGCVLLIACANVANLLLARATARKREIAIRLALGGSRGRLVRQLLAEGLLLSLCGGSIGFLLAWWSSNASSVVVGHRALAVSPNPRVLAFTILLSLFVTLLFALVPALQATALGKNDQTNLSTANTVSDQRSRAHLRNSLLVAQIALSMVSLVGAGLLLRTLTKLHEEDMGFERDHVLVTWIFPTLAGYEGEKETALYWDLLEHLNAIPGVSSASMSRMQLLAGGYWGCKLTAQSTSTSAQLDASCNSIAPKFFETMGIPLLVGRDFSYSDNRTSPKVAIISESTARDYFSGENPIGKELALSDETFKDRLQIVGVVRDIHTSLRDEQRHHSPRAVFIPFVQAPEEMGGQAVLAIRTPGNPNDIMTAVRHQVAAVAPALPLVGMQTQQEVMEQSVGNDRTMAVLTSSFGALALTLTAVGLYGSIAYSVARRTREIGIRMALGSSREAVVTKLVREAGQVIAQGLLLGLLGSFVLSRAIASQLYGVSSYDPRTFAMVAALMVVVALAAAYVPARHAMSVDPIVALRYE
ncbi:MAG TPA: ABC transporter permease [Terriglobales bacterium]|nr:ABC transporter permease [Terriglobales bacterium]